MTQKGLQVDQQVEVEILEGPYEDSFRTLRGFLGVGHDERGAVFGEVVNADIGSPAFTCRRYRIGPSEHFDFGAARDRGLILDMDETGRMLKVPGPGMDNAMRLLVKPVAALETGDTVTVKRNPDHPAWMHRVEGEYGTEYVLPDDFEPVVEDGAVVTREGSRLRVHGFLYTADGFQEGARATLLESKTTLAGGTVAAGRERAIAQSHAVGHVADRYDRARGKVADHLAEIHQTLDQ